MSAILPHPDRRYCGDTGEMTATLRRSDAPADCESCGVQCSCPVARPCTDDERRRFFVKHDNFVA